VQLKGTRTKQYCSDRCRLRAYRKRQRDSKPVSAPADSAGTDTASSRPSAHHRETDCAPASACPTCFPQSSGKMSGGCGVCGTPLVQPIAGPDRKYCSDRCRLRAYRERHAS
jgi:predicted nucleic acid-binding Zn ribbon protein